MTIKERILKRSEVLRDNLNYLEESIDQISFLFSQSLISGNKLLFCGNESLYKITSTLGDLNNDANIDVLDIVVMINLILSNNYQSNADMNGDQSINVLDVVQLVNIILL